MFELLVIACVGGRVCEYKIPPLSYGTEAECQRQAALIAGTVAGRNAPGQSMSFRFRCSADGMDGGWVQVTPYGQISWLSDTR